MCPFGSPFPASACASRFLRSLLRLTGGAAVLLGPAGPTARADAPFGVTVTSLAGIPSVTMGYGSFPDLLSDVLNSQARFAPFGNTDFVAQVTFLGMSNAITASSNQSGTSVTLAIPGIQFSQVFTGASRDIVEQKIRDFFIRDGNSIMGRFLASVARTSPMAVTDGNPGATTNRMADSSMGQFGFTPATELSFGQGASVPGAGAEEAPSGAAQGSSRGRYTGFGIGLNSGHFEANGIKGSMSQVELPFSFSLGKRVSLTGSIPLDYLTVEGGRVFGVGLNLGLPVRIKIMSDSNPWGWRLTPMVGISARGSQDLAGGGVIWMGGLSSGLNYRLTQGWIVGMVNQAATYQSMTVQYSGYKFDPQVDQQILKNGFRVAALVSPRLMMEAFVIRTDFLREAAVKDFMTLGAAVTYVIPKRFNLVLGLNLDNGTNFKSWSVGLSSAWSF